MNGDRVVVTDITILTENSENFEKKNKYPSTTTLCRSLLKSNGITEETILENINSSYPIIHYSVVDLIEKFLEIKKAHGSNVEKQIYNSFKSPITDFIDRLLRYLNIHLLFKLIE